MLKIAEDLMTGSNKREVRSLVNLSFCAPLNEFSLGKNDCYNKIIFKSDGQRKYQLNWISFHRVYQKFTKKEPNLMSYLRVIEDGGLKFRI